MSDKALIFEITLLDSRFHGVGHWPPSPFRVFQALVAGAYGGRWRVEPREPKDAAFKWLETLEPPVIVAPPASSARATVYYVPNNDLDAVGGDPANIADVRAPKESRPILLGREPVFAYAWRFGDGAEHAARLCELSERLHTFGRGIDAAFARGATDDWERAIGRLTERGRVAWPSGGGRADGAAQCPSAGSLDSLIERHGRMSRRFERVKEGRNISTLFRQPPKARCRLVAYDRPPARLLFDLRPADGTRPFRAVAQQRTVDLATGSRDLVAKRLAVGLPDRAGEAERFVIGRGVSPPPASQRVRIVPLPTIGHTEANPAVRRVLVEVPPECPFSAKDVAWALTGQALPFLSSADSETGALTSETVLVPTEDHAMLWQYGVPGPFHRWRSITPVALPLKLTDPVRSGHDRVVRDAHLADRVRSALRHAGFDSRGAIVRVQREPFRRRGLRAESFAAGRFPAAGLWHVEVTLAEPVGGPMVLGDGRWLGLGVMAPEPDGAPAGSGVRVFAVKDDGIPLAYAVACARALRRAVLARAGSLARGGRLPRFFTGHEDDGAPAASDHRHLSFLADDADDDGFLDRVAIVAPRPRDSDDARIRQRYKLLDTAVEGLTVVRAGRLGVLRLEPEPTPGPDDPIFGRGHVWESRGLYSATRHPKRGEDARQWLADDLLRECARRDLPRPSADVLEVREGPRGGLTCRARLTFAVDVQGPLALGPGAHFGDGLFGLAR